MDLGTLIAIDFGVLNASESRARPQNVNSNDHK